MERSTFWSEGSEWSEAEITPGAQGGAQRSDNDRNREAKRQKLNRSVAKRQELNASYFLVSVRIFIVQEIHEIYRKSTSGATFSTTIYNILF